jgi:CBS domain-containing protein
MIIKSIRQIIEGRQLPSLAPDLTVRQACHVLDQLNVGAAAVLEDGELAGVFSERDVIRKCICKGQRTDELRVRDIMTANPKVIDIDGRLADALTIMEEGGFRHLPVIDNGRTAGMLSMRDIPTEYRLMHERYVEAQNHKLSETATYNA